VLANFNDFIAVLEGNPNYKPNEADAQVPALHAQADAMLAANDAVDTTYQPYENALKIRDTELYFPKTGFVSLAKNVKIYVRGNKSITASSKKLITDLQFTTPPKKDLHF